MSEKLIALTRDRIVSYVRDRITSGAWEPGSRLPTRRDLGVQFDTTLTTVQRAFDALARDGFLEARGKAGTFLVRHPPHLFHYGLVFPCFRSDDRGSWSQFFEALCNEADAVNRNGPRRVEVFQDIDSRPDNPRSQELAEVVRAHRLAGLIFARSPDVFTGTPLLDEPRMGRVALVQKPVCKIPAIVFDMHAMVDAALDYFAQRGRRRVAILTLPDVEMDPDYHAYIRQGLAKRGLTTRPYWMLDMHRTAARSARSLAHLLAHEGQRERPDALFIADDNLVEPATAGLLDAQVRVPQDVEVVAHCNVPWLTPSRVPAKRIGFNITEVLSLCIERIDLQRRGVRPIEKTVVRPSFVDAAAPQNGRARRRSRLKG